MRVLLIAPTFFGYRARVAAELAQMGHEVEVMNDRPSESTTFKSLAKASYRLVDAQIGAYARDLASSVAVGSYDRVIYMGGMSFCFTPAQFAMIRNASHARFMAYLWDSFENCQRFAECAGLFDEVLSFEPTDCERCGLRFRPLFYDDRYARIPVEPEGGFEYDACFVGSVHQPGKYEAVLGICKGLEDMGMRVFKHFYMPSRSVELLRRATRASYRGGSFTTEALSMEEVASVYGKSRAVIDSPQSGQLGLTMRTLEVLGSGRKLITNNRDVANYDFYDPVNVFVSIGGSVPPASFFEEGSRSIPERVSGRYSIQGFCEALLGNEDRRTKFRKEVS